MQVTCVVCLDERLGSNRQECVSQIPISPEPRIFFFLCERLAMNMCLKILKPISRTLKSRAFMLNVMKTKYQVMHSQ